MRLAVAAGVCATLCLLFARAERNADGAIRITPVDFFSGDLKRLEDHLDFGHGPSCFKIKGQRWFTCRPEIEVWAEGKRIDISKYASTFTSASDEVSFVVRDTDKNKDGRVVYRASVSGIYRYVRYFEGPPPADKDKDVGFGPIAIGQPVVLKKAGDSVVVWARGQMSAEAAAKLVVVAPHGLEGDVAQLQDIEKHLKQLQWVMILRLSATEKGR
jgi:hypothetical protein